MRVIEYAESQEDECRLVLPFVVRALVHRVPSYSVTHQPDTPATGPSA